MGIPEILIISTLFGAFCVLAESLLIPSERWRDARQSKVAWVLVQALLPVVGSLIFVVAVRPRLRRSGRPTA